MEAYQQLKMELSSDVVSDFMHNLPEKFPAAHKQHVEQLATELQQRKELILDFNGLQASIDPAAAPDHLDTEEGTEQINKVCQNISVIQQIIEVKITTLY